MIAKPLVVAIAATAALPTPSRAQSAPPDQPAAAVTVPTRFGAKAAISSVTVSVSGDDGEADGFYQHAAGFAVGAVAVHPLTLRLKLQGELLYIRKGTAMDIDQLVPGLGDGSMRLDYVEAPVLARYEFGTGTGPMPFFYGGAALAVFVTAGAELDGEDREVDDDDFGRFDVSLQVGGGVEVPLSSGTLTIDARYSHGLLDTGIASSDDISISNRVHSLFVGYLF